MKDAHTAATTLPNMRGVNKKAHPTLSARPPLLRRSDRAAAGGCETPKNCINAMDVAGAYEHTWGVRVLRPIQTSQDVWLKGFTNAITTHRGGMSEGR